MNCNDIAMRLDDWLDGDLPAEQLAALEAHAAGCAACAARVTRARDLLDRLRRLPVPEPDERLFDRAFATAIERDHQRRRWRWLGTGGALAASLVLVIGLNIQQGPQTPMAPAIPGLSIALSEEREISLVVDSTGALDSATFTVVLPPGIELAGYPGQNEISWEGRLESGSNLLVLPLRALAGSGGDVVTHIRHTGREKTFIVRMEVNAEQRPPPATDAPTLM